MKKIAVNTVKAFLKEHKNDGYIDETFTVGDASFDVKIKTTLTTAEKTSFINRVLSGCFDAAGNFRPEYLTPMIRATILQICTNIPAISLKGDHGNSDGSLMDLDAMNDLYVAMNLDGLPNAEYQKMLNEVVQLAYNAVDWARNKKIAQLHDAEFTTLVGSFSKLINTISEKVDGVDTDSLMEYAVKLSNYTEKMKDKNIVEAMVNLHSEKAGDDIK